jgi:hypothetical protein
MQMWWLVDQSGGNYFWMVVLNTMNAYQQKWSKQADQW